MKAKENLAFGYELRSGAMIEVEFLGKRLILTQTVAHAFEHTHEILFVFCLFSNTKFILFFLVTLHILNLDLCLRNILICI